LSSCFRQTHPSFEVLVFDDSSSDGTLEAVSRHFPAVKLFRSDRRQGYIRLRNRGFGEAAGKFVFSLDDDAEYSDPDSITATVRLFERWPDVAAVAMPYVEPGRVSNGVPSSDGARDTATELRSYVGCAHAVRKTAARELGGYRELFVHQGEEVDLCIRLLNRGHRIIYGATGPIIHRVSEVRDIRRMDRYGIRNTLLFELLNVPMPHLFPRLLSDALKLLAWNLSFPTVLYRTYYLIRGLGACLKYARLRSPVSQATYQRFLRLPRHGPEPWTDEAAQHLESLLAD
jgi:GT2 family glycosyltransferase